MAKPTVRLHVVLTPTARNDIREALIWSEERFGQSAATRYRNLISQALRDLATDPTRPGSLDRSELARGVRTYHLSFSRRHARDASGIVHRPRHFLVFTLRNESTLDILRLLHDARDLERHLPEATSTSR